MEATVENILEGCVHDHPAPPMFTSDELAGDGRRWSRPAPDRREDDDREDGETPSQHRLVEHRGVRGHHWVLPAGCRGVVSYSVVATT